MNSGASSPGDSVPPNSPTPQTERSRLQGGTLTLSGSFRDFGNETYTVKVTRGDTVSTAIDLAAGVSMYRLSH